MDIIQLLVVYLKPNKSIILFQSALHGWFWNQHLLIKFLQLINIFCVARDICKWTMHSGRRIYWAWGHRKNICYQKNTCNSFNFDATEMVLTSKWGKIKPQIQIWYVQCVDGSRMGAGRPKTWEKMLIELRSAMTQVAHSAMISGAGHSILWKAFELILDRDSSRRQDSLGPKLRQWGVSPWYASISWIILDQHQFQDRHRWCDKQQPCNYCWISERNHFNDINLINSACFRPMGVMSSWCRVSYVWENKSFRHLDII